LVKVYITSLYFLLLSNQQIIVDYYEILIIASEGKHEFIEK